MKYPLSVLILLILVAQIRNWNLFAHSVIARMAEIELSKDPKSAEILQKVYSALSTLTHFFPEIKDSLLEAAVVPDMLNFNFKGFLAKYHYKDFPELYRNDNPNFQFPEIDDTNAEFALNSAISIIKDSLVPDSENQKYIKKGFVDSLMTRYVVHLVGDVHQPLHATSLFSEILQNGKLVNGDAGGNLISIFDPYKTNSKNLHSFWDNGLGMFPNVSKFPYDDEDKQQINRFAQNLSTEFPASYFGAEVNQLNHKVWIEESHRLASQITYADIDILPVIRPEYVIIGRGVCKERVALAGYRLANLLRDLFK